MSSNYCVACPYLRLMLHADQAADAKIIDAELSELLNDDYINGHVVNRIFEAMNAHGIDSWVTQYADQLGAASHGPLSFAALSAPNLEAAIGVITEFSCIRSTGTQVKIHCTGKRVEYVLTDLTGHALAGRWLIEISFLVLHRLIETIIAHPIGNNAQLSFAHSRPDSFQSINELFNTEAQYGAEQNVYSIPLSWIEISSPLSDSDMYRINLAKCRELRLALEADPNDVKRIVSTRLLNHFDLRLSDNAYFKSVPSLESVAAELCMSPRTLIRKLAAQNTCFRKILEQVRQTRAQQLLSETHLTASEISELLDYQEPANFARAFRRWFQQTPIAWRRSH